MIAFDEDDKEDKVLQKDGSVRACKIHLFKDTKPRKEEENLLRKKRVYIYDRR